MESLPGDQDQLQGSTRRRVRFAEVPVASVHETVARPDPWEPMKIPAHTQTHVCCRYIQSDIDTGNLTRGFSCICNAYTDLSPDALIAAAIDPGFVVDAIPRSNGWWPAYHPVRLAGVATGVSDGDGSSNQTQARTKNAELPILPPPATESRSSDVVCVDMFIPGFG